MLTTRDDEQLQKYENGTLTRFTLRTSIKPSELEILMMRRFFLLLATLTYASSCFAANIWSGKSDDNNSYIVVDGELTSGDDKTFNNLAIAVDKGVVLFNSPGGLADVGMAIGRTISIKGFATGVLSGFSCASSCGLAWLVGRPRLLSEDAKVGFHAIFTVDNGTNNISSDGNALVGSYLRDLGFSDVIIRYATFTNPNEIRWLSREEAAAIGLEVTYLSGVPKTANDNVARSAGANPKTHNEPEDEGQGPIPHPTPADRSMTAAPSVNPALSTEDPAAKWNFVDNVDFPGFDLPNMPFKALTASACYTACDRLAACFAYTFNREARACFLKRGASQALQFTGAFSGYKGSNIIYRIGRDYGSNVHFRTNLGTEITAMPYSTYINKTLAWCQDDCVDDFQCRGFSYFRNGICVKFTVRKPTRSNNEVYSGVKLD